MIVYCAVCVCVCVCVRVSEWEKVREKVRESLFSSFILQTSSHTLKTCTVKQTKLTKQGGKWDSRLKEVSNNDKSNTENAPPPPLSALCFLTSVYISRIHVHGQTQTHAYTCAFMIHAHTCIHKHIIQTNTGNQPPEQWANCYCACWHTRAH